jgi:hypothetical protein
MFIARGAESAPSAIVRSLSAEFSFDGDLVSVNL